MLSVAVPAVSDPDKSTSHAVIVTAPLLLVTVLPVTTVNVPLEPVESESALITSAWPDADVVMLLVMYTPAAA